MTLTQTQKRNLQIFKNELGYSRIEHLLSIYYEDQLRKEVSNIFQEMRYEVVKNLAEYYNPEIMVNAQMDLILAPIQEAHKKYYETLLKYKIREFDKSRQQGKRIVERMLNFKRKGNVLTKRFVVLKADINDTISSTISKDKLFGTSDVAHDNLAQRTYQLSEGTLSRVDKDINQIITKGYDEGHGINTVSHNVTTRFNQLESWEAVRIARTEIHNSHSLGLIQGYDDMDVEYIQWSSAGPDGRTRDSHLAIDGEIIPMGATFSNGLMYPGDMNGSAEEVINCRCQALPFIIPYGYIAPPDMIPFREEDLITTLDYFNADSLISQVTEELNIFQLNESRIPTLFPSDNTPLPYLEQENIKRGIEGFNDYLEYVKDVDVGVEYVEIFTEKGESLLFKRGGLYGVDATEYEIKKIMNAKYGVMIHNHPSNFDNVHSFTDLITQLEYNFRYSIVESHTKRYIVVNKCELSSNSKKQIINNLKKDNLEFKTKIKNIVDDRLSIKIKGHDYDFYQIEEIRSDIYEQVTKEHMPEFEEKISKYFDDNTGLKLYVHDRV